MAEVRVFTGNEIAILLADYLSKRLEGGYMQNYAAVASAVSSKICASMARKRGFEFHEALTRFKWLNKNTLDLETKGKPVLLCYEEALGFNVTQNMVRGRDGISAAAFSAEMAGVIHDSGSTPTQRLEELMHECGVHLSKHGFYETTSISATTTEVFDKAGVRGFPRDPGGASVAEENSSVITSTRNLSGSSRSSEHRTLFSALTSSAATASAFTIIGIFRPGSTWYSARALRIERKRDCSFSNRSIESPSIDPAEGQAAVIDDCSPPLSLGYRYHNVSVT